MITASAQQPQQFGAASEAFKVITGNWKAQATFSSRTNDFRYATDGNNEWKGLMYGSIKPNGQMIFKAANGCMMTGVADPFASQQLWSFTLEVEGCPLVHFNGQLFGNVKRTNNGGIFFEAKDAPFSMGKPPIAHSINAQMIAY
jgi:hypothetical protein